MIVRVGVLGALGATQQEVEAAINALASKYNIGPVQYFPPAPYVVAAFGDDAWNGTCKLANGSVVNANEFQDEGNFRVLVANQFDRSLWWSISPMMAQAMNAPAPTKAPPAYTPPPQTQTLYPDTPTPPPPPPPPPSSPPPTSSTSTTNTNTQPSTPVVIPATVQLLNLSRPNAGLAFQVGDRFAVRISGAPNTPVSDTATHNGSTTTTVHGQTSASGSWSFEGVMGAEHIGNWSETWKAGSTTANPVLSFSVAAAPQQPATNQQTTTTQADDSDEQLIGTTAPSSSLTRTITDALPEPVQALANNIGMHEWPWWIWAAVAAGGYGAIQMLNGGRRR